MGREQRINELIDNDNERFQRNRSMTLTMKGYGVRKTKLPESEVDQFADYLVSVFNTPESRPMYCDAVRYLTKAFIEEEIKIALDKGIEPVRLFNHMIYKKLRLLGLYNA